MTAHPYTAAYAAADELDGVSIDQFIPDSSWQKIGERVLNHGDASTGGVIEMVEMTDFQLLGLWDIGSQPPDFDAWRREYQNNGSDLFAVATYYKEDSYIWGAVKKKSYRIIIAHSFAFLLIGLVAGLVALYQLAVALHWTSIQADLQSLANGTKSIFHEWSPAGAVDAGKHAFVYIAAVMAGITAVWYLASNKFNMAHGAEFTKAPGAPEFKFPSYSVTPKSSIEAGPLKTSSESSVGVSESSFGRRRGGAVEVSGTVQRTPWGPRAKCTKGDWEGTFSTVAGARRALARHEQRYGHG